MLNGNAFINMVKTPEFKVEVIKAPQKKIVKPNDKSIDKLTNALSVNGMASRKWLIDNSELSSFGVDNCINYLLEKGDLMRHEVGMCGPYKAYNYELINN